MSIRAEQDPAFKTDRELYRLRKQDESYTARLYKRVDELLHDEKWLDETLHQYSIRFVPFVKEMEDANEIESVAIVKSIWHTLEKLAMEQAKIDVKDEE